MQYVFFLGSHPDLSEAELMTTLRREGYVFTAHHRERQLLLLDMASELPANFIDRVGGTLRIGRVLGTRERPWTAVAIQAAFTPKSRKFSLGLSGMPAARVKLKSIGQELKSQLKRSGHAISFILPRRQDELLNAAQVLFNRLIEPPNAELVFIRTNDDFVLVATTHIQDIRAYTRRDRHAPHRDAAVGMLPPKVAQMMLNLVPAHTTRPPTVYDPFCGTGTVILEGMLLGWQMIGSDTSEGMVHNAIENAAWAQRAFPDQALLKPQIFRHDVREPFPFKVRERCSAVVTEPYLGRPLHRPLPRAQVVRQQVKLADLYLKLFTHARQLFADEGWIVLALPAVREQGMADWTLMPQSFLDEVMRLGYRLVQLVSTARGTIIYSRPDALVGREISLWHIRKQAVQRGSDGIQPVSA
ncbi:MAG: hypothetical protein HY372_02710 [Candidatus Andersenbacteria bacterium]|nr:hypothetical protein [Candidatus Andersenbacteria bacterium]